MLSDTYFKAYDWWIEDLRVSEILSSWDGCKAGGSRHAAPPCKCKMHARKGLDDARLGTHYACAAASQLYAWKVHVGTGVLRGRCHNEEGGDVGKRAGKHGGRG